MHKHNIKIIILLFISGLLGLCVSLYTHQRSDKQVHFHTPFSFVNELKNDPKAGEKIFYEFCASCHAKTPIIDVHAPVIGNTSTWRERKKKGIKKLLYNTINGKNAMPARGGCFECEDKELLAAIFYILKKS